MKIFNQENGLEKAYIQVGDLMALTKINVKAIPQTVMQKMLSSRELNEKDFVEFTSPEELNFFSVTDWIIDYRIASKQSREVTEGHIKLLITEINDITYSFADLAEQEIYLKEVLGNEYDMACHRLIQYKQMLDIKDNKEQLTLPLVPDSDSKTIRISTDNVDYSVQRSLSNNRLMFSRADGEKLKERDTAVANICLKIAELHLADTKGEVGEYLGNENFSQKSPDGKYIVSDYNGIIKTTERGNVKVKEKNNN